MLPSLCFSFPSTEVGDEAAMVVRRVAPPPPKQKQISFGYCDIVKGERVYPLPTMSESDLLPEQLPPQQIQPSSRLNDLDDMYCKVTCHPPLGQATTVPRDQNGVEFSILLETSSDAVDLSQAQVCIWHNHGGHHEWAELHLKPSTEYEEVLLLNRPSANGIRREWFTAHLSGSPKHGQAVSFTVKFLLKNDQNWRWAKDLTGVEDGELSYQSTDYAKHSTYDLNHWFSDISQDIKWQNERPDTDETYLYSLTSPVSPAKGQDSGWQHHQLGIPSNATRWFSLVRLWSPWLAPRQGKGKFEVDKDAVLISFLRSDGLHVVVLGISGVQDVVTTFFNDKSGNVIIKGRNDKTDAGTSTTLVAVASSFEVANAAVFYHARKVVAANGYNENDAEVKTLLDPIKPDWLEEWYDGLTYCTWNGLGQNLTEQKIYDALDALSKENINVTNLIIDDNWQSLSKGETQFVRGWSDFEANAEGFPKGMKRTTTEIRKRHPNINHIAVWHAILGYWGGIDPEGWIAQNYKTIQVEKEPGVAGGVFTVVAPEDANRMYNDFYAFLSDSGVDSVKTDAQFFLDLLLHAPDRREMITTYQDAWTIAHLRHLSSRAISCMSQAPQILFHSQLPQNKPKLLVRNSDDFFPEVAASHPWHIFCNAHNSLLTQHLNVLPDWDMFQTSHEWAGFHAAARAVSGGPIYFTDTPGKHDITLIKQMTAQTARDKTVILRPSIVGKAMNPYNEYSALTLLKIGTYVGMSRTGAGILGIFNVSKQHLSEFTALDEFPGTKEGEYVIGSFTSGQVSKSAARRGQKHALVGIEVEPQGWDILTAYNVQTFELKSSPKKPVGVAMLGLVDKMTGSAAVTGYDIYVEDNGRLRIWVSLKALGILGIWISELKSKSIEDDFIVLIFGKPIGVQCVKKSDKDARVLEIDIGKAWRESGEKAGWSNEVTLEVFMH
ncbi:putative galactinol--sucrose galactosyltransferase 2 [Pseudocercospora fuligena]|uniref:Putative galactinol--sucrose galactosyltransferase 2 n=1 Tax=Pseudocercospora fuligena TaxID=685502 RepID=A0A8H6VJ11_9PEZI|nr:putative galactinol--sucrose galactosyltransferase 2 [Pseudocercospora fuligena]